MKRLKLLLISLFILNLATAQFLNFNKNGQPILRLSTDGNAIDAHDGEIAYFNGMYYLYGTSYACGFEWGNKRAPFCGFKVYTSKDLKSWEDKGFLFDAKTQLWQCRCDGKTYGCFRPHVVFNKKTQKYVLWVNVYDNKVGYRVFTASRPTGPFVEVNEPELAVNRSMPAKGLNNGDHDLFIDDDGTAYLAYTDWRTKGSIVIEKLRADYLSGTGVCTKSVTDGSTEAPALFKRKGRYYILYSDPNCGYCGATGTSYKTAPNPLGPWSKPRKISKNSCGGQPSFVSVLPINSRKYYVYGSDLWNNGAKNEALANYFWTPLSFDENGEIMPIDCKNLQIDKQGQIIPYSDPVKVSPGIRGDIANQTQYLQQWKSSKSGILSRLELTLFKMGYPTSQLTFEIFMADGDGYPFGQPLFKQKISADALGWAPAVFPVFPKLKVKKNVNYVLMLKSSATEGSYGVAVQYLENANRSRFSKSRDGGRNLMVEQKTQLKISYKVSRH